MSGISEIGGDKQTIEGSLNSIHSKLKCYTNDQITILDDLMLIIESFYKTEKHTHEKMQGSLQKSLEHAQGMSYLGSSIIGTTWTTAVKELMEHYAQREASYPVLKQVILENLKKIKNEKTDENNKVLLYDEEIIKEMVDIERRTVKSKRVYDEAYERLRQHLHPVKEKESGIKRLHQKILPKTELERLEASVVESRNMYILHVNQMNYALKFYIEQFIVDLDKLLACDLFPQIEQIIDDLVYSEYKRLRDTLQRAIHAAVEDGNEQKRRLLPKTFQKYPLILESDQSNEINTDDRYLAQLSSAYVSSLNDVRDADQQIQLALESSVLHAQQNKDSRMDSGKIRLKRMEMRKLMASFITDSLEILVPNIKSTPTAARTASKLISGLRPFITGLKTETNSNSVTSPTIDHNVPNQLVETDNTPTDAIHSAPTYPCQAIVLYDFEATNQDEMSVRKDDKIFIESKPDYDGWLVAKGRDRSGFVPEAYVQLLSASAIPIEQGSTKNAKDKSLRRSKKHASASASIADDEADDFSDD